MMLSTRADPPRFLDLPKAPKSTNLKQLLLHSPLPSPSLPSILPRHGKKPPRLNTQKALRLLCWLTTATVLVWMFQRAPHKAITFENPASQSSNSREYRMLRTNDVPKYASPVTVRDKRGKSRWTISIPSNLQFPLSASDYSDVCSYVKNVSTNTALDRKNLLNVQNLRFDQADPNYVDIEEAQQTGMLPAKKDLPKFLNGQDVCKKSLTYILDASEAGLGDALIGLWLSYGLAQKEGRAFFIDYSNFAYGKFTSLFSELPPSPDCRPPAWEHRTPCPQYARHLLVSSSTLKWIFGYSFQKEFNTKDTFEMARTGYKALFHMRSDDKRYVETRLAEQRKSAGANGVVVGIHVRRGDRHPLEFQYQHGYLPPVKYMSIAQALTKGHPNSIIMLASDDADIYQHPELEGSIRAQEMIKLASNKHMSKGGLGWEGGFFKDAFWDIGLPEHALNKKYVGSPEPSRKKQQKHHVGPIDHHRDYRSQPTKEALQIRELVGRAYLLDLAVLAGSDEVICGVSSKGCRILAIMMGWEKLHHGHWRNVDGDYGWRALFEQA